MNKDNIKGKVKDMAGRAERQVGEWTGDNKSQGEGLGKQAEGKVQKAWGDLKDSGRKLQDDIGRKRDDGTATGSDVERDINRKDEEAA
jgi:uncharacterized protein YjbJ (UPF0337 family)